jgi:glucose repression mediator protein
LKTNKEPKMKKSIVLLAISAAAFVGCEQRETDEAAGAAKDQAEQSLEASKEQLDAQKEQVESQAKAEKEQIEAQADAQKAQLKAEEKQLEASTEAQKAQAEAQQAQADAQQDAQQAQADAQKESAEAQQDAQQAQADSQQQIQESAGAAAGDKELEAQVRKTIMGDAAQPTAGTQNVQIMVKDGKVTLNGTVQSDAQKAQLEQQAKGIQGVKTVENNLKIEGQ